MYFPLLTLTFVGNRAGVMKVLCSVKTVVAGRWKRRIDHITCGQIVLRNEESAGYCFCTLEDVPLRPQACFLVLNPCIILL